MKKILSLFALAFLLSAAGTEFKVTPGNSSFADAVKKWQPGDIITLAPGEYPEKFREGVFGARIARGNITIRAAIPGTAVFRGDRPAPKFTACGNGIWKAQWDTCPETVFERDTLRIYTWCGNISGLKFGTALWTWDAKTKTIYIRPSDSQSPEKHYLTIGVTPDSCINFYCHPDGPGIQDVLLEGFLVTGYYSRCLFPDQRLPSSQLMIPWGIVINHPTKNVVIRNITAMLNGYGIGCLNKNENATIEDCKAWGNRNPYNYSMGGVGFFGGVKHCTLRNCIAADNSGQDICLYGGPVSGDTVMLNNIAYGHHRTKCSGKDKNFTIRNSIAGAFTFVYTPKEMQNCVDLGFRGLEAKMLRGGNLILGWEPKMVPNDIFADLPNFDARPQGGIPQNIAKRCPAPASDKLFFVKEGGNDKADGRSVKNAFGTLNRALKELQKPGAELYIAGAVKGDLKLKGLKSVTIRGRGDFAPKFNGKIKIENCSDVKLIRLMPDEIEVKDSQNVEISQSTAKLKAEKVNGLRLTHNYFTKAEIEKCGKTFITANVFDEQKVKGNTGWSDYNAYAENVPAGEKHSYKAKAIPGRRGTFKNAWLFDGRGIDAMPVGPYRRQAQNVTLVMNPPQVKAVSDTSCQISLSGSTQYYGTLNWGDTEDCKNTVNLSCAAMQSINLTGLKPGKKYYYRYRAVPVVPACFSNAELIRQNGYQVIRSGLEEFTAKPVLHTAKEYFVAKNGSDKADGSRTAPFATISHAVTHLEPGDILTIHGGVYEEEITMTVSGTPGKPITIRGAKGETVRLCAGFGDVLKYGFKVVMQNDLIFENMWIIGKYGWHKFGYSEAPMLIHNSKNITIRGCAIGGAVNRLEVDHSKNLLVENCIITNGHEGVSIFNTDAVFRNCTIIFGGVNELTLRNYGHEKILVENCVIGDMLNMKGCNPMIHVHDVGAYTERNNCYFTRFEGENKLVIGWNYNGKQIALKTAKDVYEFPYLGRHECTYPQYLKELKRTGNSISVNPGLKILPKFLITYKDTADWFKRGRNNQKNENLSWKERGYSDQFKDDWNAYVATNPEVVKRGCGIKPK